MLPPSHKPPDDAPTRLEANELLQAIVDTSPSMIFVKAADGRLLFVNRYAADYYQTTPELLLQSSTAEVHPDIQEAERFVSDDKRVANSLEKLERDELNTAPDGSKHWFHTVKVPLIRSDGTVQVLGIATDISARKEAEARLRESDEKLRMVIAATKMGLWEWDVRHDEFTWDDTMLQLFGVDNNNRPRNKAAYVQLVHPDDRELVTRTIEQGLETGVYEPLEHRIVLADGSIRHLVARASITRHEDGSMAKFIGGVLDITEDRAHEARRREAQKLEAVGQLSAGIAHNFNNMLMGIIPNIELALPNVSPEVAELLHGAQQAAVRASELVKQLVTFSGQSHSAPRRSEDVRPLLQRTLDMCERAFDRSIELGARFTAEPSIVNMNATQLEQVFLNLLINARDAVAQAEGKAPWIFIQLDVLAKGSTELAHLELNAAQRYIRVQVRDNGAGMDAETQRRVFEPFFTTKGPGRGTGLGLSTAATIVKEHGGVIELTSSMGEGSCFSVYLPQAARDSEQAPPSRASQPARAPQGSVLVVDDERMVRSVVVRILNHHGYQARGVGSAHEALELLMDEAYRSEVRLVILDMSMPGMSGRVLRGKLRELIPQTPVVYFTGYSEESAHDSDRLIQKPVTASQLIRAVQDVLDGVEDSQG